MIFKALLRHAIQYVNAHPDEHGSQLIKYAAEKSNMSVEEFLLKLDIRDVGILRDYLPKAFPRRMRVPAELKAYQNNLGAWCVENVEAPIEQQ